MSSDGLACSVVWPEEREYVILSNGGQGDAWQKLDAGPATAVAWSSTGCSYAVLHVTKVGPGLSQPSPGRRASQGEVLPGVVCVGMPAAAGRR